MTTTVCDAYIYIYILDAFPSRCRHGAIAKYFGDSPPNCSRSCDYCRNPIAVEQEWEQVQRGVCANSNPKRHLGRTAIAAADTDEPDMELYGGGKKGAKL